MALRVGFIGLGVMGEPMAGNLLKAGYGLTILNRGTEAARKLEKAGAKVVADIAELVSDADVVFTMLPADGEVRDVYFGTSGVLQAARKGQLLIDTSSVSPSVAMEIAAWCAPKGIDFIDAPVSGGDKGAREATLSIMVGGSRDGFARAEPFLSVLGQKVIHVGDSGAGQVVKACNQVVVAGVISALSEGLLLAERHGVPVETVLDVLGAGLAGTKVGEVRRSNFITRNFAPGFRVRLHKKDLDIALSAAARNGIHLPVADVVRSQFEKLMQRGEGDLDHTAVSSLLRSEGATSRQDRAASASE